eukprot:gene49354-42952_t
MFYQKEKTARWMVHQATVRLNGTAVGHVVSTSDGVGLDKSAATGRIFAYLTPMDAQGADIAADGAGGEANLPLNGRMVQLSGGDAATAKAALFSKHPQMASWPAGHGFAFWELRVTDVFFIDMFGGADHFSPDAYYSADL